MLDQDESQTRIKGVFSSSRTHRKGAGATSSKSENTTYWLGKEVKDGLIQLQSLDMDYQPQGKPFTVPKDEFFQQYQLEPELWYKLVNHRLLRGDSMRNRQQFERAESEYKKVVQVDEDNIRANFGLGLVYLAQDETEKAGYALKKIVELDEAFDEKHKHLFNEFGIALRKKRMFQEALEYYNRSLRLCKDDENILFNMARAYYEMGSVEQAFEFLRRTLELNVDMGEARTLLRHLYQAKLRPSDEDNHVFLQSLLSGNEKPES